MRVLVDYHHHDLWESLELLFTDRFGWELLRPIGMDWFEAGYWNHERKWHGDAIARQYLTPWGSDADGYRLDVSHNRRQRIVTLDEARDLRPDIVISTLAHNHEGFARFAGEVGARFGLQIGNVRFGEADMAEDRWDLAEFGLVSGVMPVTPPKPHVVYHQEFKVPEYDAPPRWNDPACIPVDIAKFRVSSFVQCYAQDRPAYQPMLDTAAVAPELDWRVYGAYGEAPIDQYAAGNLTDCDDVTLAMQLSDVGWHLKRWSDGYGHVIHRWFAVGRPVIGFESYYRDQLAGPLWQEGVTTFRVEDRSPDDLAALLRRLRDDEDLHLRMSEAARERFDALVNFDEDAERVKRLLEGVL